MTEVRAFAIDYYLTLAWRCVAGKRCGRERRYGRHQTALFRAWTLPG